MKARFCFRCGREFYRMESFCPSCGSGRRSILVSNPHDHKDAEELIKYYFNNGTQYKMIVLLLKEYHNIPVSIRTLKRWLKRLGLKRRGNPRPGIAVRRIIESEIKITNGIKGYRSIWHKLKINGIQVNRDDVMNIIKDINPEQSRNRRTRKLERRIYTSPGPNAVWHADGYDKLKPYGFLIHGCIDGFSRKVLWLRVCRSNNDPIIPAHFFLTALKENKICPDLLKTDCGTENGIMASMQSFFHNDSHAHRYGASHSNQRIENLWSHYKRTYTTWIINFFKDLVNTDALRLGDHFQMECAWFVFSDLLQAELDKMKKRMEYT